jgi:hypothetical protein
MSVLWLAIKDSVPRDCLPVSLLPMVSWVGRFLCTQIHCGTVSTAKRSLQNTGETQFDSHAASVEWSSLSTRRGDWKICQWSHSSATPPHFPQYSKPIRCCGNSTAVQCLPRISAAFRKRNREKIQSDDAEEEDNSETGAIHKAIDAISHLRRGSSSMLSGTPVTESLTGGVGKGASPIWCSMTWSFLNPDERAVRQFLPILLINLNPSKGSAGQR